MSSTVWSESGLAPPREDSYGLPNASDDCLLASWLPSNFYEAGQHAEAYPSATPELDWTPWPDVQFAVDGPDDFQLDPYSDLLQSVDYADSDWGPTIGLIFPLVEWIDPSLAVDGPDDFQLDPYPNLVQSLDFADFAWGMAVGHVVAPEEWSNAHLPSSNFPPWDVPRHAPTCVDDYDLAHPPLPFSMASKRAYASLADPPD
jgi:hypothetical protein